MAQRGGIVTVSCGDFRCRLEGFDEPLAALAAVAPWLATAPWGEDGPGDPPARGAPFGIRREIRNGALVLMPSGRGAEAPKPALRAAGGWGGAPSPALGADALAEGAAGLVPTGPEASGPALRGGEAPRADRRGTASNDDAEEGLDLRLLARVARAAASEAVGGSSMPQADETGEDDAAPVESAAPGRAADDSAAAGSLCSPSSPADEERAGSGVTLPRGTDAPADATDPAATLGAGAWGAPACADTADGASEMEPMAALAGPGGTASAEGGAAAPAVPLRPRRPVLPVGAGGSPRVSGPGADVRTPTPRGTLPPLRLLPAQRVEPLRPTPLASAPSGPVRPRRPVHRRDPAAPRL